jgi:hypothetical protein
MERYEYPGSLIDKTSFSTQLMIEPNKLECFDLSKRLSFVQCNTLAFWAQ